MEDAAFRTQQFTEAIAQRRDQYAAQRMNAMQQVPGYVNNAFDQYQQGAQLNMQASVAQQDMLLAKEENQRRMLETTSRLSLDELRRNQAIEELRWARELHSDSMLAMEVQRQKAELRLREAQIETEINKLGVGLGSDYMAMSPEGRLSWILQHGRTGDFSGDGRKWTWRDISTDERTRFESELEDLRSRRLKEIEAIGARQLRVEDAKAGYREGLEGTKAGHRMEQDEARFKQRAALAELDELLPKIKEIKDALLQENDPARRSALAKQLAELENQKIGLEQGGPTLEEKMSELLKASVTAIFPGVE